MNKIEAYIIGKTQGFYEVKTDKTYLLRLKGTLKKENSKFNCVIGDRVEFDEKEQLITKIYKRKNMILRPLVSNIDNVALVFSIKNPNFDFIAFQKKLLWSDMENIETILIINKIDLVEKEEYLEFIKELEEYNLNIKVFPISIEKNIGIEDLLKYMKNKTIVLSGFSGVGKSSLVNKIMGEEVVLVGDISSKTKKGKNTTIITKYFEKDDIKIFDTPGYSSFEIPNFKDTSEILSCFKEFEKYALECKFKDCKHILEPFCGVKKALDEGEISIKRYEFYKNILEGKYDERN